MANASGSELQQAPTDIAGYVAEMSGNLADMARGQGLDTLAYILEMAKLEAENNLPGSKRGR
jgi:hypothetical protein